jgi:hypothetical protein
MTPLPEQQLNAIYALVPPSDPKLLHGNTLCGKKVTYIALSLQSEQSRPCRVYRPAPAARIQRRCVRGVFLRALAQCPAARAIRRTCAARGP